MVASHVAGSDRRRESGSLEQEVLAALWVADEPLTPAQVRTVVSGDLAYTTVMTTLSRLHAKGVVERARAGRAYAYSPAERAEDHAARAMADVLARGTDTTAVLTRFVDRLRPDEEAVLRELLVRARRGS